MLQADDKNFHNTRQYVVENYVKQAVHVMSHGSCCKILCTLVRLQHVHTVTLNSATPTAVCVNCLLLSLKKLRSLQAVPKQW